MEDNNFLEFIKNSLNDLIAKCKISDINFLKLLELCNIYFKDNDYRMIHGDLHFDNFLYDGNKLYLIDFETSKSSPIDYDFRIFNRYSEQPYRWASEKTDMLTVPSDYKKFMDLIIENYQELKNIKYLNERLSVYDIIELLETLIIGRKLSIFIFGIKKIKININRILPSIVRIKLLLKITSFPFTIA